MSGSAEPKTLAGDIVRYLNAQLAENHKAAKERFDRLEGDDKYHEEWRNLYAWAMYRHTEGGKTIDFVFSQPKLTFICAHNALLELVIDSMKDIGSETTQSRVSKFTMKYRVTLSYSPVRKRAPEVSANWSGMRLLFCNLAEAKIVSYDQLQGEGGDLGHVQSCLKSYLETLQKGDHHALFFPRFRLPKDSKSPDIHFPLPGQPNSEFQVAPIPDILGFTKDTIDDYLSLIWLTSLLFALRKKTENGVDEFEFVWDSSLSLLAGCDSRLLFPDYKPKAWNHVFIKFGKPTVTLICDKEIILVFNLMTVEFEPDLKENITRRDNIYHNCSVSLIVDVSVTTSRIRLKPGSARAIHVTFPEVEGSNPEQHAARRDAFIDFFVNEYFPVAAKLLRDLKDHLAQPSSSASPPGLETSIEDHSSSDRSALILNNYVQDTDMAGFDVVIAVSQTSINDKIGEIFRSHTQLQRVQVKDVAIEIEKVTLLLLDVEDSETRKNKLRAGKQVSDDTSATPPCSAILTIHIKQATLNKDIFLINDDLRKVVPMNGPRDFQACQLAFEVDLKQEPGSIQDGGLQHRNCTTLYLDLTGENTQLALEHSLWADKQSGGLESTCLHMALANQIKDQYLPQLHTFKAHILATIPIYDDASAPAPFHGLTTISHRAFTPEATAHSESILFILGMTGGNTSPPVSDFKPSTSWLAQADGQFLHGMLAVSRPKLLSLLADVNKLTTLVPRPDVGTSLRNIGNSLVRGSTALLEQWSSEDSTRKGVACQWSPGKDPKKFEWNWTHKWCVDEDGSPSSPDMSRKDHIVCKTHNILEPPDVSKDGSLKFKMKGEVNVNISTSKLSSESGTSKVESSLHWELDITIKSFSRDGSSDRIEVDIGKPNCARRVTDPGTPTSQLYKNILKTIHATLHSRLIEAKDLNVIRDELRKLERPWEYYYPGPDPTSSKFTICTPMCNRNGDLLFELKHSS